MGYSKLLRAADSADPAEKTWSPQSGRLLWEALVPLLVWTLMLACFNWDAIRAEQKGNQDVHHGNWSCYSLLFRYSLHLPMLAYWLLTAVVLMRAGPTLVSLQRHIGGCEVAGRVFRLRNLPNVLLAVIYIGTQRWWLHTFYCPQHFFTLGTVDEVSVKLAPVVWVLVPEVYPPVHMRALFVWGCLAALAVYCGTQFDIRALDDSFFSLNAWGGTLTYWLVLGGMTVALVLFRNCPLCRRGIRGRLTD